jgi:hypothetical protein
MPPDEQPHISMARNQFIALVIGVCVLSAAIGSGLALLAQAGPEGPAGKQGPHGHAGERGPAGPAGESAGEELGALEGQVDELRGELGAVAEAAEEGNDSGEVGELEERVEGLEEELESYAGLAGELCGEESLIC